MTVYVKVLIPLAALGLFGLKYPMFKFPKAPEPGAALPKVSIATDRVDAAVELVRAGSLPGFDKTTVGKAFEGRFQDAQWSSFQTPNGATIVNFHGTVTASALDAAGLNASQTNPIVVRSNCIRSLGLGVKMAEDAKSARVSEQNYLSALDDVNQRKLNPPGSPQSRTLGKDQSSVIAGRKQQEKVEKERAAADEARIQSCIAGRPMLVNFHFALSADQKKFQLGYVDKEPFGDATAEAVLSFVYQIAPPHAEFVR
jgi:hypothetical protein